MPARRRGRVRVPETEAGNAPRGGRPCWDIDLVGECHGRRSLARYVEVGLARRGRGRSTSTVVYSGTEAPRSGSRRSGSRGRGRVARSVRMGVLSVRQRWSCRTPCAERVRPRQLRSGRPAPSPRPGPATYVLVIAVQLAVMWPFAMKRPFDGDEGFYAVAAKLVGHGEQPYFDFWFQIHAGTSVRVRRVDAVWGESFESLRALSAVLTVGLGTLLYAHAVALLPLARHRRRRALYRVGARDHLVHDLQVVRARRCCCSSRTSSLRQPTAASFATTGTGSVPVRSSAWPSTPACSSSPWCRCSPTTRLRPVTGTERSGRYAKIPALAGGLLLGLLPCIYFFASIRDGS